jgi:sugar/nucleoside kinase (ribokinase family)
VTDFAVVGSTNQDLILVVAEDFTKHSKLRATDRVVRLGGSATVTATWLAQQGSIVSLFSEVGDDETGRWCMSELRKSTLDLSHVTSQLSETSTAVCINSPREKLIVTHRFADRLGAARPVPNSSLFDHIHVSARDEESVASSLHLAAANACTVSLELNGRTNDLYRPLAQIAFTNADDLPSLGLNLENLSPVSVAELLPRAGAQLVVTNGAQGAVAVSHSERIDVSLKSSIQVRDRTGGGDAFNAGFLLAWKSGAEISGALESGLALAVRCITQLGGCP